ncbi:hypothetical protein P153DRAFT_202254 [Dothidotthia symphoricarpi CBS 119687]|uniref:Uncharacterized protein n=1 Tax=Dothidotthia symphoricarpi CBS 119687 TaxID=1392245 RepID=A0A6A6AKI8_9PLEO|nr:uncharacterized protein P153DRAFT_202254 [Dothidotthia symphoricarpi CBS 119687]KAF2131743.1 hypothetical protein P153DRAFT_202254 [Dothidotthia symphoricarpi CBS 119687]
MSKFGNILSIGPHKQTTGTSARARCQASCTRSPRSLMSKSFSDSEVTGRQDCCIGPLSPTSNELIMATLYWAFSREKWTMQSANQYQLTTRIDAPRHDPMLCCMRRGAAPGLYRSTLFRSQNMTGRALHSLCLETYKRTNMILHDDVTSKTSARGGSACRFCLQRFMQQGRVPCMLPGLAYAPPNRRNRRRRADITHQLKDLFELSA